MERTPSLSIEFESSKVVGPIQCTSKQPVTEALKTSLIDPDFCFSSSPATDNHHPSAMDLACIDGNVELVLEFSISFNVIGLDFRLSQSDSA